ncbi:MAG TPA: DUF6626 family protein [Pseudolabrys sp.]
MENGSIDFVFSELTRIGQCRSRSQYSQYWLGRNESYFRSMQSKGLKPSAEVKLYLVARLRDLGMSFTRSDHPIAVEIGNTYLKLYGECLEALLNSAQSDADKLDQADDLVQQWDSGSFQRLRQPSNRRHRTRMPHKQMRSNPNSRSCQPARRNSMFRKLRKNSNSSETQPVHLTTRATRPKNPHRIKRCELRAARAAGYAANQVADILKNDA